MRVLVAGGAGFLGSHLVDRLLRRSDLTELVVVDNLWTGDVRNIAHVSDRRLRLTVGDVEALTERQVFDEVYHLASPAAPAFYMKEPVRTISANVVGALRLLDALKPDGLFCFTSTSEVYGQAEVTPQPESYLGQVDCTGPRAAYDESKRCVEALLFEARRAHGRRVKVARLFNVFGPRTRPGDGRAISNFVGQALCGRPITIYGDGRQTRSWGYVDDVMDALERFFWADGSDFAGPLNIGADREIPVIEVAEFVSRRLGGARLEFLPPVPQDPTNRRPDLTLCNTVIPDWRCRVGYEEGVERTIRWFQADLAAAS